MGCLNSHGQFEHWFANIHFSGRCNRACYFCIGQHMMGLDHINNLDKWPLDGLDYFIQKCNEKGVKEVNLTGTDTDPLLYLYLDKLCDCLRNNISDVKLGIRTNGALITKRPNEWKLFDKGSISITSFNKEIYKKTMGYGEPPDIETILKIDCKINKKLKINIVLCPEIIYNDINCDLISTFKKLNNFGIKKINLREPYGQPHLGDPLAKLGFCKSGQRLGMPYYNIFGMDIMYWDVHYVEVESVNLYANGNVSLTYPVTKGYDNVLGTVKDQTKFNNGGRQQKQWIKTPKITLPII